MFLFTPERVLKNTRVKLICLLCLVFVAGCSHVSPRDSVIQYYDKSSGVTITTLAAPFSFYRKEPMLAVNSRDYIYVGPLETNATGHRDYLLWLYYCSTIGRYRYAEADVPNSIFMCVDGKPMELVQASANQLGESTHSGPDTAPVAGGYAVLYRVTRDQLRTMAQANQLRLVAETQSGNADEYTVWRGAEAGLQVFADYLLDDVDIILATAR